MRRLCSLRGKYSIQYLKSSERTSCPAIWLWVHWSESHIRNEKCPFQMVTLKRQFIQRKQKHLHFLQSPPGGSEPSTMPCSSQLELQEKCSLVVTVTERRCWHSVNVSQGCSMSCNVPSKHAVRGQFLHWQSTKSIPTECYYTGQLLHALCQDISPQTCCLLTWNEHINSPRCKVMVSSSFF